jgi:RNA polymerase sigma-70 factor (ECF subfamily)
MESIEALVARLQAPGTSDAERQQVFRAIVACLRDSACSYAYALLGDAGLAEDVAQEAFLTALRSLKVLHNPAAFPGWLRRIIRTHCHRLTRGKQYPTTSLDAVEDPPCPAADPTDILEGEELRRAVRVAIHALPERERTALLLFYLGGYSLAEIATFLAVPVTTVKKRLQYGRRRLKDLWPAFIRDSLEEFLLSNESQFARRIRLLIIGDALAAEGYRAVDDLLRVDGADNRMHVADLQALRHVVTQEGYRALLEALLLDGVDLHDLDVDGYSPFAWATEYGDLETLARLLPHRADRCHSEVDPVSG